MNKEDLRIIFMGTPEFAVATLDMLVSNNYNVVAVVTQPDKPVGRHGSVLQPSQVKEYAMAHGLPVLQPVKMKDPDFVEELRSFNADLQVVVAFRMLPEVVWDMPRFGTFNVHAALLPKYRGAAPINWAVINGENKTGVTTFFLDHDIDTGRIIEQREFTIPYDADVEYVYDGLMHLGAEICQSTIDKIIATDGNVDSIPQLSIPNAEEVIETCKAPKIFKETCKIEWGLSATRVYNFVRGLAPYPGAWTQLFLPDGKPTDMKIFKTEVTTTPRSSEIAVGSIIVKEGKLFVACIDYMLQILQLQLSGKRRMDAKDFINGFRTITGCSCI